MRLAQQLFIYRVAENVTLLCVIADILSDDNRLLLIFFLISGIVGGPCNNWRYLEAPEMLKPRGQKIDLGLGLRLVTSGLGLGLGFGTLWPRPQAVDLGLER